MLKIITVPNPILSGSSKKISKIDKNILKLIEDMMRALLSAKDPEGVGLAAPQIGKSLRLFITKPGHKSPMQIFINPRIVSSIKHSALSKKNNPKHTKLEGCLSLPNIWGEVNRQPSITISYLDAKGKNHTKTFKGLSATIVQHEVDHLNGTLFPKRILEQKGTLYKSRKDEKGEDIFEEIDL